MSTTTSFEVNQTKRQKINTWISSISYFVFRWIKTKEKCDYAIVLLTVALTVTGKIQMPFWLYLPILIALLFLFILAQARRAYLANISLKKDLSITELNQKINIYRIITNT